MTVSYSGPTPTILPQVEHPTKPKLALPPDACDSHFHIFGPHKTFPFADDRPFTPYDGSKEDLFALHKHLGFSRGLIVQSTAHGHDDTAMLDAIAHGNGNYRGVALLTETTPETEVDRLDKAGVVGVRFHFMPSLGHMPDFSRLATVVGLVRAFKWHIAVHGTGHYLIAIEDFVTSIDLPVIIDHMGRTPIGEGVDGEAFKVLRRLLDSGKVWVKLSGIDRISVQDRPFRDGARIARYLADRYPQRILWGTDWPHPNSRIVPDDGELVDAVADIAPDEKTRRLMLVDNPASLFRFGT